MHRISDIFVASFCLLVGCGLGLLAYGLSRETTSGGMTFGRVLPALVPAAIGAVPAIILLSRDRNVAPDPQTAWRVPAITAAAFVGLGLFSAIGDPGDFAWAGFPLLGLGAVLTGLAIFRFRGRKG